MKAEYHHENITLKLQLWEAAFIQLLFSYIIPSQFTQEFVEHMRHELGELLLDKPENIYDEQIPFSFICEKILHTIQIRNEIIRIVEAE